MGAGSAMGWRTDDDRRIGASRRGVDDDIGVGRIGITVILRGDINRTLADLGNV